MPSTDFRITSAHLKKEEIDLKDCLGQNPEDTCFPKKLTPGPAIDYQNRYARVENLPREEFEKFLVLFADQAPHLQIDKEEAWGFFECAKGAETRTLGIEIGKDEIPEGVRTDGVALSDAQFQLESKGWDMATIYNYHIHPKYRGFGTQDIYRFSIEDLDKVTNLAPLPGRRFSYIAEERVVTPVGVYVLRLNEQKWESRGQYYDRFQKGIEWFIENEEELVARCFTPGRDLVEASGCFAIGANTLMAAHAQPVVVSFIPVQDR